VSDKTSAGSAPLALEAADYVVLIVADLDAALTFYTNVLGLRLAHRTGAYAQLDTGRTRISLYERSAMSEVLASPLDAPAPGAPSFELGFKVADVDAAFSSLLEAGAESACSPTDRAWGQRTAYLRDPDGYLIELAQDL
jgi:lactoylglutathione lyase